MIAEIEEVAVLSAQRDDGTDKYSILDYNNFAKSSPAASVEFRRYKDLHNKYYMHVANEMTEGFAFF